MTHKTSDDAPLSSCFVTKKNKLTPHTQFNQMSKSRAWCITLHGDDSDFPSDCASLWESLVTQHGARYCCAQREIAPTTLRRHYQGYVYFTNQHRLASVRKLFSDLFGVIPHCEIAKGSPEQNRKYCSKEDSAIPGTFIEYGTIPMKGKRGDLDEIAQLAKTESLSVIADTFPSQFIRYHRGIAELQRVAHYRSRDPSCTPTVEWWFGPTGTGKSRDAFTIHPTAYVKMNNKWWDGYLGEQTTIIDDYRPSLCTFQEFLKLLDRYPMRVECKGSSMPLATTHWIITTTLRPEVIWAGRTEEALNQLLRRITIIKDYSTTPPTVLKDQNTLYVPLPSPSVVSTFTLPSERVFE